MRDHQIISEAEEAVADLDHKVLGQEALVADSEVLVQELEDLGLTTMVLEVADSEVQKAVLGLVAIIQEQVEGQKALEATLMIQEAFEVQKEALDRKDQEKVKDQKALGQTQKIGQDTRHQDHHPEMEIGQMAKDPSHHITEERHIGDKTFKFI